MTLEQSAAAPRDDAVDGYREFWEWLPRAYRDGDQGDAPRFTKYNMMVAFQAGRDSRPAAPLPEPVALLNAAIKMRDALDALYNHDAATRAAVVMHYGTTHPPIIADELKRQWLPAAPLPGELPSIRAALEELVALKDMKDRLQRLHESGHGTDWETYRARQPRAWEAARAALSAAQPAQPVAFDADDPRFREAFEESARANNYGVTREGERYRSAFTDTAYRLAFGTVNRLRLYAAAPAQPAQPETWPNDDISYEVWQDDMMVAGSTDPKDAGHYAMQYEQDGPVTVYTVIRRNWETACPPAPPAQPVADLQAEIDRLKAELEEEQRTILIRGKPFKLPRCYGETDPPVNSTTG